jgi:hypothetical protein
MKYHRLGIKIWILAIVIMSAQAMRAYEHLKNCIYLSEEGNRPLIRVGERKYYQSTGQNSRHKGMWFRVASIDDNGYFNKPMWAQTYKEHVPGFWLFANQKHNLGYQGNIIELLAEEFIASHTRAGIDTYDGGPEFLERYDGKGLEPLKDAAFMQNFDPDFKEMCQRIGEPDAIWINATVRTGEHDNKRAMVDLNDVWYLKALTKWASPFVQNADIGTALNENALVVTKEGGVANAFLANVDNANPATWGAAMEESITNETATQEESAGQ